MDSTKIKKRIDKKLCICYADNTAKLKKYIFLLMSLERGVTVCSVAPILFPGGVRQRWADSNLQNSERNRR